MQKFGAVISKYKYELDDEIVNSIKYHTTGRKYDNFRKNHLFSRCHRTSEETI